MLSTYPIDFNRIEKGTVIAPEEIERAMAVRRGEPKYQLAVLRLRGMIERELELRRDLVVTCKQEGDALRVLTDEEAAGYNPTLFEGGLRKAARAHWRNSNVNRAELDDRQQVTHERNLLVQGRILQAVRTERKRLRLEKVKRPTPGKD